MEKRSDISGLHKMSIAERAAKIKEIAGLSEEDVALLGKTGSLDLETADRMIENVIGTFELPIGIATNFKIDGKDYLIPMVIEEPSVVAASSKAAKIARTSGGFKTNCDDPIMIGQMQIVNVPDLEAAEKNVKENSSEIIKMANEKDPVLIKYGGGVTGINTRVIDTQKGKMLIVHLHVNVSDAMGANVINTMAEHVSSFLEKLTGGQVKLRIISNLAVKRLARSRTVWKKEDLAFGDFSGEEVIEGILYAYEFAQNDKYRCTTHNKGIMNGIDAITIATGNDFRALESGAHSYASKDGEYKSLTHYEKDSDGNLVGSIELPIAVGIVGGSTSTNPIAKISLKILGVKSSKELAGIIASVGLAQNFAALRALSTEGIQRGHMELHAKNIAIIAGASGDLIDRVAQKMVEERNVKVDRAKEILEEISR
ncbi:MAG: hydroxymethylglutaryl-CoA reductase, degradative [Candidatus Aenigmatarchaeota archaeon]